MFHSSSVKMVTIPVSTLRRFRLRNRSILHQILAAVIVLTLFYLLFTRGKNLLASVSHVLEVNVKPHEKLPLLRKTVNALERTIDYLFVVGEGMNLDAVLGVRMVEDQLRALRRHVITPLVSRAEQRGLQSQIEQLDRTLDKARQFCQRFTKAVERNQPEYYESMSFLLTASSWELWFPQRDINRHSMPTYGFEKTVQETLGPTDSDACVKEPFVKHCQFTKKCWDRMVSFSRYGYSLTHEVFFIMTSYAHGCEKEIEISAQKLKNMHSEEILDRQMAAVLYEAELIANEDFPPYLRDLFMEQVAFGGILGYREFFRDEWLEQILSWQDDRGCFLLDYNVAFALFASDFPNHPKVLERVKAGSLTLPGTIQHTIRGKSRRDSSATSSKRRQKRNEIVLNDGCWAHMTGVAVVALSQSVRYLLEPMLSS